MLEAILPALLANWPIVLIVGLVAYCLKNYLNHGLNKYPGPAFAHVTDWWRFFDVLGRRPDITHLALHRKHGDVVRLGPNTLSFANPKAIKQIYGLNKGMVKSDFYPVQQAVSNGHRLPSLFSTTDEAYHAQLRRSVNNAFSMSALVQYEPLVNTVLDTFLSQTARIYASPSSPQTCNFAKWLQYLAFDVIGQITYSHPHGFVSTNTDIDGMIAYLARLFSYVAPIGQIPFLDLLCLKNPLILLLDRLNVKLFAFPVTTFAKTRMNERLSEISKHKASGGDPAEMNPAGRADLLSMFLKAQQDKPDFMTDARVLTMAVSMAFAGSETTAISLAAVFYYLLRNPSALHTLREEIDTAVREARIENRPNGAVSWTEAQSSNLPYLDACIKEAFRVHPAAGLPLERIVPPPGMEIDGVFVPGGTIVGCNAWVIHKRAEVFDPRRKYDVDEYRPERWLDCDKGMFCPHFLASISPLADVLPQSNSRQWTARSSSSAPGRAPASGRTSRCWRSISWYPASYEGLTSSSRTPARIGSCIMHGLLRSGTLRSGFGKGVWT
jgi:cytochrome P450